MMVPKIISYAASVVAQYKKNRVRALDRGTRLKSKRHSLPASLLRNPTNVLATRLERRSRTAQSNRTQSYVAHCNWNVLTLTRKELDLVEEGKKYHLNIVGVSSNRRHDSGIVDWDDWCKLSYSGADPSIFAQPWCRSSHKTSVVRLCV